MPAPCALILDNLTVVRVALCTRRITRLSPERMRAVCEALRHATAC
jgi:mRNA-degrading endonuclease toxin of MazEF toxin-antitoxin module